MRERFDSHKRGHSGTGHMLQHPPVASAVLAPQVPAASDMGQKWRLTSSTASGSAARHNNSSSSRVAPGKSRFSRQSAARRRIRGEPSVEMMVDVLRGHVDEASSSSSSSSSTSLSPRGAPLLSTSLAVESALENLVKVLQAAKPATMLRVTEIGGVETLLYIASLTSRRDGQMVGSVASRSTTASKKKKKKKSAPPKQPKSNRNGGGEVVVGSSTPSSPSSSSSSSSASSSPVDNAADCGVTTGASISRTFELAEGALALLARHCESARLRLVYNGGVGFYAQQVRSGPMHSRLTACARLVVLLERRACTKSSSSSTSANANHQSTFGKQHSSSISGGQQYDNAPDFGSIAKGMRQQQTAPGRSRTRGGAVGLSVLPPRRRTSRRQSPAHATPPSRASPASFTSVTSSPVGGPVSLSTFHAVAAKLRELVLSEGSGSSGHSSSNNVAALGSPEVESPLSPLIKMVDHVPDSSGAVSSTGKAACPHAMMEALRCGAVSALCDTLVEARADLANAPAGAADAKLPNALSSAPTTWATVAPSSATTGRQRRRARGRGSAVVVVPASHEAATALSNLKAAHLVDTQNKAATVDGRRRSTSAAAMGRGGVMDQGGGGDGVVKVEDDTPTVRSVVHDAEESLTRLGSFLRDIGESESSLVFLCYSMDREELAARAIAAKSQSSASNNSSTAAGATAVSATLSCATMSSAHTDGTAASTDTSSGSAMHRRRLHHHQSHRNEASASAKALLRPSEARFNLAVAMARVPWTTVESVDGCAKQQLAIASPSICTSASETARHVFGNLLRSTHAVEALLQVAESGTGGGCGSSSSSRRQSDWSDQQQRDALCALAVIAQRVAALPELKECSDAMLPASAKAAFRPFPTAPRHLASWLGKASCADIEFSFSNQPPSNCCVVAQDQGGVITRRSRPPPRVVSTRPVTLQPKLRLPAHYYSDSEDEDEEEDEEQEHGGGVGVGPRRGTMEGVRDNGRQDDDDVSPSTSLFAHEWVLDSHPQTRGCLQRLLSSGLVGETVRCAQLCSSPRGNKSSPRRGWAADWRVHGAESNGQASAHRRAATAPRQDLNKGAGQRKPGPPFGAAAKRGLLVVDMKQAPWLSRDVLSTFLEILYTGRMYGLVDEHSALALLRLAKTCVLPDLHQCCQVVLSQALSTSNVSEILSEVLELDAPFLVDQCLDLMLRNMPQVVKHLTNGRSLHHAGLSVRGGGSGAEAGTDADADVDANGGGERSANGAHPRAGDRVSLGNEVASLRPVRRRLACHMKKILAFLVDGQD